MMLYIICGLPGVGKTTFGQILAMQTGAVILRSDTIRKELALEDRYGEEEKDAVYKKMFEKTKHHLGNGRNIILDATFVLEKNRQEAINIASKMNSPYKIIRVIAPEAEIIRRIKKRFGDASQADVGVYHKYKNLFQKIKGKYFTVDNKSREHELKHYGEKIAGEDH